MKAFADTEAGRLLARMEAGKKRYGWEREMALFVRAVPAGGKPTLSGRGNRKEKYLPGAIYNPKVMDLLAYLREHLFEEISTDGLAETFYISKYHMMRLFKQENLLYDPPLCDGKKNCGSQRKAAERTVCR